jgi:uncharacterized protein (DUF885 family)
MQKNYKKRVLSVLISSLMLTASQLSFAALAADQGANEATQADANKKNQKDSSSKPTLADKANPVNQTTKDFVALYTKEWAWRHAQFANDEDSPLDSVEAHLPHVDKATQDKRQKYWEDVMQQLNKLDVKQLSADDQVNYAIYKNQIESLISEQQFKLYERPFNGDSSFWGNLVGVARHDFRSEQDYRKYLKQLSEMPRYFGEQIDNMRAGLKRNFTMPKVAIQGRDASVAAVLEAKTAEENIYFTPFKKMPSNMSPATQQALQKEAAKIIDSKVVPAYQTLLQFLRVEYFPHAQDSTAAYDLPDGKNFYQAQIKSYTTLDLSPEQIHQIGLDEVAGIRREMAQIMDELKFKGDLAAFLKYLRTSPEFYATSPQDLLNRAAWIAKTFDGKSGKYFGLLPRQRFAIIPVPPDIAPVYTSGRGGPGVYLVNTYDLPSRGLYSLPALTLHESAPGHAMQMSLSAENKGIPEFRQNSYISAYGEGWALYSERLGVEMGMYSTPYELFGMLSYQMWRACRLVVDTGIHAKHWTREQAQQYLHDNTALSEHEIETEVDRYITWPGQADSYYLGSMSVWKNRHRAEAALGEKFDIRAFHDAVLALGSVPLSVLDARIDQFIAQQKKLVEKK